MNLVYAKNAEKNLLPISIAVHNIAVDNVLEEQMQEQEIDDIQIIDEYIAETFDIEVSEMHEFFANGILVHNCIDAARYYVLGCLLGKILKPKGDIAAAFAR
ncbi:hypothetical protein [Prevotella pallens]|uniref:hypothetical protein n=1 Tax=Prevotella pallens TaxID=60133 RepID=UPI0036F2CE1A